MKKKSKIERQKIRIKEEEMGEYNKEMGIKTMKKIRKRQHRD